jgi:hypothetical protein
MTTFTTWCKIFLILCLPYVAFSQCDPLTSAGQISGEESQCNPYDPSPLLSAALPSGGTGALEYVWLITTDPAIPAGLAPITPALMIPGVTGETYDPSGLISQTTWYRRCARRAGCTVFNGETNWIKKEVGNCPTQCFAKRIASNTSDFCSNLSTNIDPKPKYGIYTNDGTSQTLYQIGMDVLFQEFTNNQAKLSGSIVNTSGVIIGTIDVQFFGRTTIAPNGSPKTILCSSLSLNTTNWSYYPTFSGVITINGLSKNIINDGAAFQVGVGANLQENVFGASGWWKTDGTTGDININLGADQCTTCNTTLTINGLSEICKYGAGNTLLTAVPSPLGTYDYLWSDGKTTPFISVNTTGDYSVTVSKSGTCTASATKNVKVNECCNVTDPGDICCNQSSCKIPFDPSIIKESAPAVGGEGEIIYLWLVSIDGVVFDEIPNSNTKEYDPEPVSATTYYRRCVARKGCNPLNFESSNTIKIEIAAPPTVKITGTDKFCVYGVGKSVLTAIVTGGNTPITYIWSNNEKTQSINATATGNYKVTATTNDGCSASANFAVEATTCCNVTEPGEIAADEYSCLKPFDPSRILETKTASGGEGDLVYLWLISTDPTLTVFNEIPNSNAPTYDPAPITQTTWYRRCVARKGCNPLNFETANTVKKEVYEPQNVTLVSTNLTCKNDKGGIIATTTTGAYPPYSYLWSSGQTSATITSLEAGKYDLTVTDAKSCKVTKSATVKQPTNVLLLTKNVTPLKCNGGNDGSITVSPSGGTSPYTIAWKNGFNTLIINNLSNGNYTATVTDAIGCSKTINANVSQPSKINLQWVKQDVTCFGQNNASVSTAVTGGTAPYSYAWSNGKTTANVNNLAAGTYNLTVADANKCTINKEIIVKDSKEILASICKSDAKCSNSADGSVKVNVTGGSQPFTYLWNNGSTTHQVLSLPSGAYSVTVMDAKYCKKTATTTISAPSDITVSLAPSCSCPKGAALNVSGGTPPYRFSRINGGFQSANTFCNLPLGKNTITVKDANNCTKVFDVNITPNGATARSYTIDFDIQKKGLSADLQWITDSEFDDAKYIIERSVGTNNNFQPYKMLLPKAKRDFLVVYQAQDESPTEGKNYYRLRQVFLDGTEKISAEKMLFFEKGNRQMLLYPNPTSDFINISLKNVKSKSGTFFIYNSQGRLLQTLQADDLGTSYQIQLENMQSGIYKVVLITDNQELITDTFRYLTY